MVAWGAAPAEMHKQLGRLRLQLRHAQGECSAATPLSAVVLYASKPQVLVADLTDLDDASRAE